MAQPHPYRSKSYNLPSRKLQPRNNSYRSMSSHEHWSSTPTSRSLRSFYANDDFYDDYLRTRSQKKSIFSKAKDKAKKWRQTLMRTKSKNEEGTDQKGTPPWGVSLNDDDEEDDFKLIHGTSNAFDESDSEKNSTIHYPSPSNPAGESAPAPAPKIAEWESEMKHSNDAREHPPLEVLGPAAVKLAPIAVSATKVAPAPDPTTTTTTTDASSPSSAAEGNATPAAAAAASSPSSAGSKSLGETMAGTLAPAYATVAERLAPAYAAVAEATMAISSKIQGSAGTQFVREKGASMREYLMQKLAEPKAEDRALCKVITEAVSPRTSGANGALEEEKMKTEGAPASSSTSSSPLASPSSPVLVSRLALAKEEVRVGSPIPISTHPQTGGMKVVHEE